MYAILGISYRSVDIDSTIYPGEILVDTIPDSILLAEMSNTVRAKRDSILRQSDWTQLPDTNITNSDKQLWIIYRQALRDLTSQPGFPNNITWPVAPSTTTGSITIPDNTPV